MSDVLPADSANRQGEVLALCGGVGGAKLALGLYRVVPAHSLTVVVNTADDFEHLGFHISPDLDTVLYTLAGLNDPVRGWGRRDETWHFMDTLESFGGPSWFRLGDRDLAMHVERTQWLHRGGSLTGFASNIAHRMEIAAQIVPMSDDAVRTTVETAEGPLAFQNYFVERRCEPTLSEIRFRGATHARPADALINALARPNLNAIIICPSNPYLSIDPLLSVPGIRAALARATAPVVAVSPLIGGNAIKGPTAKIMNELGIHVSSQAIATHYKDFLDGLVIDRSDAEDRTNIDVQTHLAATLMNDLADRERLAREVLQFAATISLRKNKMRGHISARTAAAS